MCTVTESSSLPAFSRYTKLCASCIDLKAVEGGQLYILKDLDHLILSSRQAGIFEVFFTH